MCRSIGYERAIVKFNYCSIHISFEKNVRGTCTSVLVTIKVLAAFHKQLPVKVGFVVVVVFKVEYLLLP